MLACGCLCPSDSKIRIFDGGAKRTDVHTFPAVVHLVSQTGSHRQADRQTDWWRQQAGAGVYCMHSPTAFGDSLRGGGPRAAAWRYVWC